jgi:hypothetical protein
MRNFLTLAAVAAFFPFAAVAETTYTWLTEETVPEGMVISYAGRQDFSNICTGPDSCPALYVPIFSPKLIDALCNKSPPMPANMWPNVRLWPDGSALYQSFSSPTCSWVQTDANGETSVVVAVAFEADGTAWARVGLYYSLLAADIFEPFTPTQFIEEVKGIKGRTTVFYSEFPLGWTEGGLPPQNFVQISIYEAESLCNYGLFYPYMQVVLGPKQGVSEPTALFAPACIAIDPRTSEAAPLVIFGHDGTAYYEKGLEAAIVGQ